MANDFGKGSGNSACKAGLPAPPTLKKNLRGSARVILNLRVRVSAPVERREYFLGEGETIDVSHDGASIMLARDLRVGQTIRIRRVGANKEVLARVVGCYRNHTSTGRVFGVAFSDTDAALQNLNNRSDERLRTETVDGIRNLSVGNQIVLVSGLAPEGVNFFSSNQYPEGASLEMAIPYTSTAPNVSSLVRIVGARRDKDGSLTEYRAAYLV